MLTWARVDPSAALAVMAELPYDQQRGLAQSMDKLVKEDETRSPYLQALVEYPDGPVRARLLEEALDEWSGFDPAAAAGWFDTLEFSAPEQALGPAFELAENWFESAPRTAVDWVWPKIPAEVRKEFVTDFVHREWANRDPEGAKAWLEENGLAER